jgi:hypothetical protein
MKIQQILISLILAIVLVLSNIVQAFAVPPHPSGFYGTVKINGANVPFGTQVSACINGVQYALSAYNLDEGVTVYNLDVPGDDPGTPGIIEGGVSGDTVEFYIGGTKADQTGTWQSGTSVNLNLTVAITYTHRIFLPLVFR